MNSRITLFAIALSALVASCSIFGADDESNLIVDDLIAAEMGDMGSIHVCGNVWLGELPSKTALDIVNRRGFRTLISLMPSDSPADREVAAECRSIGLAFVPVGIDHEIPDNRDVDRVMQALNMDGRGLVLMYSQTGSQAIMFFAIYRVVYENVPLEAALEAARRCGMTPDQSEFVRAQVARLLPS